MSRMIQVEDFAGWRNIARGFIAEHTEPQSVCFVEGRQQPLFAGDASAPTHKAPNVTVPKPFLDLAEYVAMHRDPERWNLLYRILYRVAVLQERRVLQNEVDPDIGKLFLMRKELGRDIHKMHAFVRFRKAESSKGEEWIAWHRPDHYIVEHVGPWFARRFGAMRWAILTPDKSAFWDTQKLRFGPGAQRSDAPGEDALEELWRSYYRSVFNPARVNPTAMKRELPVRHWATLPEADIIPQLIAEASQREKSMREQKSDTAETFLPSDRSLTALKSAIGRCRGCDLYLHATQAVFGEGPRKSKIMFVGEQPGDQEDLAGKPFVGPAGQLWNRALEEAGIDRSQVYVTNAVKHFKFEERGKRRIHKKPRGAEVAACRPWLSAEIAAVEPEIIVALGATAALSVGGREYAVQKERGQFMPLPNGRKMLVTVHPSFLLRVPEEQQPAEFEAFVRDLKLLGPFA